jgi:hypothetical protein
LSLSPPQLTFGLILAVASLRRRAARLIPRGRAPGWHINCHLES